VVADLLDDGQDLLGVHGGPSWRRHLFQTVGNGLG
jgi:hypothetical protein